MREYRRNGLNVVDGAVVIVSRGRNVKALVPEAERKGDLILVGDVAVRLDDCEERVLKRDLNWPLGKGVAFGVVHHILRVDAQRRRPIVVPKAQISACSLRARGERACVRACPSVEIVDEARHIVGAQIRQRVDLLGTAEHGAEQRREIHSQ